MSDPTDPAAAEHDADLFENPVARQVIPVRRQSSFDAFEQESATRPSKKGSAPATFETEDFRAFDALHDVEKEAKVAEFVHEMTDDELSDLTYAFQACDSDGGGTIESDELHAMINVLGCEVGLAEVTVLLHEAKVAFERWTDTHDEDTVLPDEMLHTDEDPGAQGSTMHGGTRHHSELNIEKRSLVTRAASTAYAHPAMKPIAIPVSYSKKVGAMSWRLAHGRVLSKSQIQAKSDDGLVAGIISPSGRVEEHMTFAEFVHMMGSKDLVQQYAPGDWYQQAAQMRVLRGAFETADVDGSNTVEIDELEMVVIGLDPTHSLTHEDIEYLWQVLTLHKEHLKQITFVDFCHGMIEVNKDDKCQGWLDINKPNKWELLSLLIDTPINKEESAAILDGLPGIEKFGINMVAHVNHKMDKDQMKEVLNRVGEGKLRKLNDEQLARMHGLRWKAILWSGLIGFVFTIMPAAVENWCCYKFEVDGFKDAYWVCHTQSTRVVNSTSSSSWEGDDWYEPATVMNPDEMLCTTAHVRVDTCVGDWYENNAVEVDYYDGPDKHFYLPGARKLALGPEDTDDSDREGWVQLAFATAPQVLAGDTNSIANMCDACECVVCACINHDEGEVRVGLENSLLWWWIWLVAAIGLNIVFEIGGLMYVAMHYATKVAWALNIRLSPLNADRAFVADSLVRAAFELGNPDAPLLGVDPHAQPGGVCLKTLMMGMYKGKVVLTGLALKFVVGKVTEPQFGMWAKPWLGMVTATIAWDALIAHCIVMQAQIRGFGIFTSCELFNEIMDYHYPDIDVASEGQRIQITTAIGVSIVKSGYMYPTMELMLRHAIQYLGLRGKACVSEPGVLDNEEVFLRELELETTSSVGGKEFMKSDKAAVLSVLLTALLLDGDIGRAERKLWKAAVDAVSPGAGWLHCVPQPFQ